MSDAICGVAVLDDRNPSGLVLFCVCVPHPAKWPHVEIARLPMGVTEKTADGSPQWHFREDGDELHCHPSVLIQTTRPDPTDSAGQRMRQVEMFHNGYNWTTKFVRWSSVPAAERELRISPWSYCRHINAQIIDGRDWTKTPDA